QARPESLPFEELRDDIRGALVGAELVDRQNPRVVQAPGGLGLLLEPPEPLRIRREGLRQNFDGDVALQPLVARAVDLPHSAGTDGRHDLVGADPRAWSGGHGAILWERVCGLAAFPARLRGADYSYRSASMGSSLDALTAGYRPKKMPTEIDTARPRITD